ncbi:glycoside hydrolase family 108 protein, partial [Mesorhizobium sp.]|jgi:lysozyme family protein|uniref:glycoside hydrolase family 108 protein n=1 Tax=Mesorhizobium sp. TaxID=1871066 RepID=UPI003568A9EA
MDRNFARALALVLRSEGGWSDNPADPGGATMKGVTLANFRRYVKADATKADLRKISDEQVATVYRRFYWDAVLGAELPDGVDYAVFDFAVNSGPGRAAKYLQAVVGAVQDGRIGPATIAAAKAKPAGVVIDLICDARLVFLKRLPTWATFGRGWSDRVKSVRAQALLMSAQPPLKTPVQPAQPAPIPPSPQAETPAGNATGMRSGSATGRDVPLAAKAGGIIAACLVVAYAAWHHIAAVLQGIF